MTDNPRPRRDFLHIATAATGATLLGAAAWALIRTAAPSAEVYAGDLTVDLPDLQPGQSITVTYNGWPVLIRHRTREEIAAAEASAPKDWVDPITRNYNLPASATAEDANRRATRDGRLLILVPVCTRGDCFVMPPPVGDFGGYFCPCCATHYDTAGRVRKGPGPKNLLVPPYRLDAERRTLLLEAYRWRAIPLRRRWS